MEEELVYISINHWSVGSEEYPTAPGIEPIETWLDDTRDDFGTTYLNDSDWCKGQGIVVIFGILDMSFSYNIIAPKSWVDKTIPDIYNYPKFIKEPDEDGIYHGNYCVGFPDEKLEPGLYFNDWEDDEDKKPMHIEKINGTIWGESKKRMEKENNGQRNDRL